MMNYQIALESPSGDSRAVALPLSALDGGKGGTLTGDEGGGIVTAILTAAGAGERLGAQLPKALVEVAGRPMFLWAVDNLLASGGVDTLIITCPAEHRASFREALSQHYPSSSKWELVVGGATRQASIANALAALPTAIEIVLVHDAARPFASPDLIARVIAAVQSGHPAVIPGVPVTDTIKRVASASHGSALEPTSTSETVIATIPRHDLRAVQTPQGFRREVLERAYQAAHHVATDDAGLVEALGEPVLVIPGEASAMKITTPTDLAYAELMAPQY